MSIYNNGNVTLTVGDIEKIIAERDALAAQVEKLKGAKPALPPFPQQGGSGMPRYGIRWNGEYDPISVPMDDGYWTPYHLVEQQLTEIRAEAVLQFAHWAFDTCPNIDCMFDDKDDYIAKIRKGGVK